MRFCLTRVICGCIVMTYGSRQRGRESRAAESCSRPAAADRSTARGCRAIGARLFHFSPTSVSIPAAGAKAERASSCERAKAGVYRQAPTQFDPAGAVVRICQTNLDQRGRDSSAPGVPATRGRSWLSRRRSRHDVFSWNIGSIACCRTNWLRHISCWCPTVDGPSEPHPSNHPNLLRS
jgi:hypothetical protein